MTFGGWINAVAMVTCVRACVCACVCLSACEEFSACVICLCRSTVTCRSYACGWATLLTARKTILSPSFALSCF